MALTTGGKKSWAVFLAGLLVGAFLAFIAIEYVFATTISPAKANVDGLHDIIGQTDRNVNVDVLIVHGIGNHCIGYSDVLTRGILSELGEETSPPMDEYLEDLPDRIRNEAESLVARYQEVIDIETDGAPDTLNDYLYVLMNDPDVQTSAAQIESTRGEAEADIRRAGDLWSLVEYGLIDSKCEYVPDSFTKVFGKTYTKESRSNTCTAITRFASQQSQLDCHRLRLRFYEKWYVSKWLETHEVDEWPTDLCQQNAAAPPQEICSNAPEEDLGFLLTRTVELRTRDGGTRLVRFHELTWDPATRWAKDQYISFDNEFEREWLNRFLKLNVVNDSISDAIMYLGTARPLIQFPLLTALCRIITDHFESKTAVVAESAAGRQGEFNCASAALPMNSAEAQDFADANELVVITHSLGTRIFLDTLGILAETDQDFISEFGEKLRSNFAYIDSNEQSIQNLDTHFEFLREALMRSLHKIYAMTNQVPLIEMGYARGPTAVKIFELSDIGENFRKFVDSRPEDAGGPVQLVSLTDSNDLLSYSLRCWYQRHVLREAPHTKILVNAKVKEFIAMEGGPDDRSDMLRSLLRNAFLVCGPPREEEKSLRKGLVEEDEWEEAWPKVEHKEWFRKSLEKIVDKAWRGIEEKIEVAEVSFNLRSWRLPPIFAGPKGVHTNYFDDELVNGLIACGLRVGRDQPDECKDFSEKASR